MNAIVRRPPMQLVLSGPEYYRRSAIAALAHALIASLRAPARPQFLTIYEAAAHTGLSQTLLRRLIREGRLAAVHDRCTKVRTSDLAMLPSMAELAKYGRTPTPARAAGKAQARPTRKR